MISFIRTLKKMESFDVKNPDIFYKVPEIFGEGWIYSSSIYEPTIGQIGLFKLGVATGLGEDQTSFISFKNWSCVASNSWRKVLKQIYVHRLRKWLVNNDDFVNIIFLYSRKSSQFNGVTALPRSVEVSVKITSRYYFGSNLLRSKFTTVGKRLSQVWWLCRKNIFVAENFLYPKLSLCSPYLLWFPWK